MKPKKNKTGKLWNSLNNDEKRELILAYEESNDSSNLISHREVKKQHTKWLQNI